tara:strand:+ start:44 stop:493 length:450 start_codon:yes stop_codon:yes gene_type:complete
MQKILIFILFLLTSCGFEPLYSNKNSNKFIFETVETIGNKKVNRRIISAISIKENEQNFSYKKIILKSKKSIVETSKNAKGVPDSFKMVIRLELILENNDNTLSKKEFNEEFSYKNKDNKFDLSEYEINVENNLVDKIIENLIIYLNIK